MVRLKLADRLHNARTWRHVPRPGARAKTRETIDVLVPYAERLDLPDAAAEPHSRSPATID